MFLRLMIDVSSQPVSKSFLSSWSVVPVPPPPTRNASPSYRQTLFQDNPPTNGQTNNIKSKQTKCNRSIKNLPCIVTSPDHKIKRSNQVAVDPVKGRIGKRERAVTDRVRRSITPTITTIRPSGSHHPHHVIIIVVSRISVTGGRNGSSVDIELVRVNVGDVEELAYETRLVGVVRVWMVIGLSSCWGG